MIAEGERAVGGCLCGAIRYEVSGPTIFESQCCCKDCQKATGTGHTTIFGVHGSQLQIDGTPKTYTCSGESGGAVTRHFCGDCGGRLYTSGDMPGEVIILQAGSLDDPNVISPKEVIYMKDAVKWDFFDPELPTYAGLPPRI